MPLHPSTLWEFLQAIPISSCFYPKHVLRGYPCLLCKLNAFQFSYYILKGNINPNVISHRNFLKDKMQFNGPSLTSNFHQINKSRKHINFNFLKSNLKILFQEHCLNKVHILLKIGIHEWAR